MFTFKQVYFHVATVLALPHSHIPSRAPARSLDRRSASDSHWATSRWARDESSSRVRSTAE